MNANHGLFPEYPDVLTVHQVRAALGIGRTGVYKLLEGRSIKCFKIGNTYKIPKVALIEYITESCQLGREEGEKK